MNARVPRFLSLRITVGRTTWIIALGALMNATAGAQTATTALVLKRTLSTGGAPGCSAAPAARPSARRDNAEARRLAAAGQEAGLVGDRVAARDAFAKAAALNPTDDRIAYDLARAHEELADSSAAVREYCRYLVLAPEGREATDVRARLTRLAPRSAVESANRAKDRFLVGINNYDRARYDMAWQAFDDAVRAMPAATEAVFNRGLARAAIGRRQEALRDFEAYLAADPAAPDRLAVVRAIDQLRRPVFDAGTALRTGLVPGFGQFYTKRPALGVIVLAGVGGAAAAALYERDATRTVPYVDPNGVPVPYEETYKERPYVTPAVAGAAVLTLGAALEAFLYARRSQHGIATEAPRGVRASQLELAPHRGLRGQSGLGLTAHF